MSTQPSASVRTMADRLTVNHTLRLPLRDRIQWEAHTFGPDRAAIQASADATQGRIGQPLPWGPVATPDQLGWSQPYEFGAVLFRTDRGALAVYGAIGARWAESGGVGGFLGWPTTSETATPQGPGRYNHFDGGSIYWGPDTGAHLVYGAIRDLWAQLSWEQGALGLPTSDEQDVPGAPGARQSRFERGVITWTAATGARVTELLGVPSDTSGPGLHLQNHGNGNTPAPAPQVQRHVIITAAMDLTDDETFGSNEHGHAERHDERWVDSWDPQGVMSLIGKAGGEMRVELAATASVRPDGGVRISIEAKLFEGTSEETGDLDGTNAVVQLVPAGAIVQIPLRVNNDDEGGDFADISLTISNSAT